MTDRAAAALQPALKRARSATGEDVERPHPLGDAEIEYFCRFGAEAIEKPETQVQLWDSWGMCQRHALGFLAVESSLNDGWMFRPAVVYDYVIDRARIALAPRVLFERTRVAASLREAEPCQACALGLDPGVRAQPAAEGIVEEARSLDHLRAFAAETRPSWEPWICGKCAGSPSSVRCRLHLPDDLETMRHPDLPAHRALVDELAARLVAFARSFGWSSRGTETPADRAALLGAVGWCGGWESILRHLG